MDNQILAHTKYNCTYHIVFIPKYRRKVMSKLKGKSALMIFDRHPEGTSMGDIFGQEGIMRKR